MKFLKALFGSSASSTSLANNSEHINQEMYKKSAELAERNKTLSLLQKLDAIVLGSITHLNETAQLVTSLLVKDANFESVFIYLFDKQTKTLQRLAFSETPKAMPVPYITSLQLSQIENMIVQSVNEQTRKFSSNAENILLTSADFIKSDVQQALSHVKLVQVFPLIVRNEVIGALVLSLPEDEQALSEYRRDLLIRLSDTIGIALDNSLLYNQVQAANIRLQQLDKLKDEFVSVASHELRTPMTAIKSYLWMAIDGKDGSDPTKHKYYLERAYSAVDRLMRLVNDMLNVSRIDSGRVTVDLHVVALGQLVQDIFDEVMPRVQELGLNLSMQQAAQLPQVVADGDKVKEVLINFIGNAMKFTPKGGNITVNFSQKDGMIETSVTDTGTGIDPANIGKLFQKFSMIADSYMANSQIQGTGLGLYICKSIIDLHGGKIWATSPGRGKGTTFTFSLKVATAEDAQKYAVDPSTQQKPMLDLVHTGI